jgi:hypothetical protein
VAKKCVLLVAVLWLPRTGQCYCITVLPLPLLLLPLFAATQSQLAATAAAAAIYGAATPWQKCSTTASCSISLSFATVLTSLLLLLLLCCSMQLHHGRGA